MWQPQKRPQWELVTNSTASPAAWMPRGSPVWMPEKVAWSPQSTTAITPYYQSTVAPPIVESPNTKAIKAKRTDLVFNSPTAHFHVVSPSKRQGGTAAYGKGYYGEHFGHHREVERRSRAEGQRPPSYPEWYEQQQQDYDEDSYASYDRSKRRGRRRDIAPKTSIVYDIYDADTPIAAPQQQVWYPLAYFYRSAE